MVMAINSTHHPTTTSQFSTVQRPMPIVSSLDIALTEAVEELEVG